MAALESSKARTEEKCARLKLKLEQNVSDFAKEKELEATYQQKVDDMFFYGYRFCMRNMALPMISLTFHRIRKMKPIWERVSSKKMAQE